MKLIAVLTLMLAVASTDIQESKANMEKGEVKSLRRSERLSKGPVETTKNSTSTPAAQKNKPKKTKEKLVETTPVSRRGTRRSAAAMGGTSRESSVPAKRSKTKTEASTKKVNKKSAAMSAKGKPDDNMESEARKGTDNGGKTAHIDKAPQESSTVSDENRNEEVVTEDENCEKKVVLEVENRDENVVTEDENVVTEEVGNQNLGNGTSLVEATSTEKTRHIPSVEDFSKSFAENGSASLELPSTANASNEVTENDAAKELEENEESKAKSKNLMGIDEQQDFNGKQKLEGEMKLQGLEAEMKPAKLESVANGHVQEEMKKREGFEDKQERDVLEDGKKSQANEQNVQVLADEEKGQEVESKHQQMECEEKPQGFDVEQESRAISDETSALDDEVIKKSVDSKGHDVTNVMSQEKNEGKESFTEDMPNGFKKKDAPDSSVCKKEEVASLESSNSIKNEVENKESEIHGTTQSEEVTNDVNTEESSPQIGGINGTLQAANVDVVGYTTGEFNNLPADTVSKKLDISLTEDEKEYMAENADYFASATPKSSGESMSDAVGMASDEVEMYDLDDLA